MIQYDLTGTSLFADATRADLPTEAEMFAMTIALLLVNDMAYGELSQKELEFKNEDLAALAECIEYRLSPLAHDFGDSDQLRERLRWFVGLRIGVRPRARRSGTPVKR